MRRTKKNRSAAKGRGIQGAWPALAIVDEACRIPSDEPDTRPRIFCAPDVFERVNKAVEDAGMSGVYNVQRSLFVQPGQVYLAGVPVPVPSAEMAERATVTVEGDWIKWPPFVDPYRLGKPSAIELINQGMRP